MRRPAFLIFCIALLCAPSVRAQTAAIAAMPGGLYRLDTMRSFIHFDARQLGITFVAGRFDMVEGLLDYKPQAPGQSALDLAFDPASADTGSDHIDAVIRGKDWFDAAAFPRAAFHATGIAVAGRNVTVTGDLTIRNITHSLTVNGTADALPPSAVAPAMMHFTMTGAFQRSAYGMTALSPLIADTVPLHIETEFDAVAVGN